MRIQFEIKESLINILDQLMHSDFWDTEIKEDESGKKIIKIKDLAYNLEACLLYTSDSAMNNMYFHSFAAYPCSYFQGSSQ